MRQFLAALLLAASMGVAAASEPSHDEALGWLQITAVAAHHLNYVGTFVYQQDSYVETSRITHIADAKGEHEKLESLDGPPREIIRRQDKTYCYFPDGKTVRVEPRNTRKFFPSLLPKQLKAVQDHYVARMGDLERVAGRICQTITLEPRDEYRYGYKMWTDTNTGLLLKATMMDANGTVLEQFAFTELKIGGKIDRALLEPKAGSKGYVLQSDNVIVEGPNKSTGWQVRQVPPGFVKISEMKRNMPGKKAPVTHLVFSDGLVAVSVFIERLTDGSKPVQGVATQGAINVFAKTVSDHQVTVLGEVPTSTVSLMGNSVTRTR